MFEFEPPKQIDTPPPNQRIKKIENEWPNKNSFRALFLYWIFTNDSTIVHISFVTHDGNPKSKCLCNAQICLILEFKLGIHHIWMFSHVLTPIMI